MATRRGFLSFLGIGAGAAAAVVATKVIPQAAPPVPTFSTLPDFEPLPYGAPSRELIAAQRLYNEMRSKMLDCIGAPLRMITCEDDEIVERELTPEELYDV